MPRFVVRHGLADDSLLAVSESVTIMARPAAAYSNDQLTDMILALGEANGNFRRARDIYSRNRPNDPVPTASLIWKYHKRLRETGQFHQEHHRESTVRDYVAPDVLAYVAQNPHASVRAVAQASGISKSSVWNILHGNRFHPFHVSLHQELQPGDLAKRLDFCNWLLNMVDEDENFPLKIMFTDEANFSRDAQVNLHNAHYWAVENPHWLRECRFQRKWSFNVWAGIFNGSVIGPHFFDGTLTGHRYKEEILEAIVDAFISEIPLSEYRVMYYQHDGAPPHAASSARGWLDAAFSERWIGRGGHISWPPRSPDLNPLDFFFWGYLKDCVYVEDPTSPDVLRRRIEAACDSLSSQQLESAARSLVKRCQMCIGVEGGHFEHLL